ncbi:TIM barrel protein [Litchfieldella rifensis]|uniref:TIM barrel protein n=1 Tax=Litchfieldella rifensis TaxID=762643 RepID=A0ABV7LKE3_9GAMM
MSFANRRRLPHGEPSDPQALTAVTPDPGQNDHRAGPGTNLGHRFEHLAEIIDRVDDQSRDGVCVDSCHAFAAGYDLRAPRIDSIPLILETIGPALWSEEIAWLRAQQPPAPSKLGDSNDINTIRDE